MYSDQVKSAVDDMNAHADSMQWTDDERARVADLYLQFQRALSGIVSEYLQARK